MKILMEDIVWAIIFLGCVCFLYPELFQRKDKDSTYLLKVSIIKLIIMILFFIIDIIFIILNKNQITFILILPVILINIVQECNFMKKNHK